MDEFVTIEIPAEQVGVLVRAQLDRLAAFERSREEQTDVFADLEAQMEALQAQLEHTFQSGRMSAEHTPVKTNVKPRKETT